MTPRARLDADRTAQSKDCIGGKMLVALADPEQARLSCPCCGATGLQRAAVVNGFGVVPHHKVVPHRAVGVVATAPERPCPNCTAVGAYSCQPGWPKGPELSLGVECHCACHKRGEDEDSERTPIDAPAPALTTSEVTFAKILAAYQANAWAAIGAALYGAGLIGNGKDEFGVSPIGEALLDRARKAGVL